MLPGHILNIYLILFGLSYTTFGNHVLLGLVRCIICFIRDFTAFEAKYEDFIKNIIGHRKRLSTY